MHLPNDLITGNPLIDEQHERILNILARLRDNRIDMRAALTDLIDHFTSHFYDEERLMETYQYPDRFLHKSEHMGFFDIFVNLRAKYDHEPIWSNQDALVKGLSNWITDHVMYKDKQMAAYVRLKQEG